MSINNGMKNPTHAYQNCNTSQIVTFDGYVHMGMKVIALYVDPNGIANKNIVKYSYMYSREASMLVVSGEQ